jgi:hypothetical protein
VEAAMSFRFQFEPSRKNSCVPPMIVLYGLVAVGIFVKMLVMDVAE